MKKNSLFTIIPCLLHRFLPVHWDQTMIIVCQSLGSRPILVLELFTLVPRLFGTTPRCLSVKPFQLLPLRNIWRHISLTWPSPHRYRHSPWPVDVTELFPLFCCWTLIWRSLHAVCLRQGYWRYRSLIDWIVQSCITDHSRFRLSGCFGCCESPTWRNHNRSHMKSRNKMETGTEICVALLCWAETTFNWWWW